jgi:hypothetical protein
MRDRAEENFVQQFCCERRQRTLAAARGMRKREREHFLSLFDVETILLLFLNTFLCTLENIFVFFYNVELMREKMRISVVSLAIYLYLLQKCLIL